MFNLLFQVDEYKSIVSKIKQNIYSSQQQAFRTVNKELIILYWNIGKVILENQEKEGWEANLSIDSQEI